MYTYSAIITADLVNSSSLPAEEWLPALKETLAYLTSAEKDYQIFRGDSFQMRVKPEKALLVCFHLKASIRRFKPLDVRLSFSVGKVLGNDNAVEESYGPVYEMSGKGLDRLGKFGFNFESKWSALNLPLNIMLKFSTYATSSWSPTVATVIHEALKQPQLTQNELAKLLGKSQSNISEAFTRGGYFDILTLNQYYSREIARYTS